MNNETKKSPEFPIFNAVVSAVLLILAVMILKRFDDRLRKVELEIASWDHLLDKVRTLADAMEGAVTNAELAAEFVRDYRQKKPQLDRIENQAIEQRTHAITAATQQHETLLITGKIIENMKIFDARLMELERREKDTNFIIVSQEGHRVWRKMVTDPDGNHIPLFYWKDPTNVIGYSPESARIWIQNQRTNATEQLLDVKE